MAGRQPLPKTPEDLFEAQYQRIFEAAECRTQAELAELLGIKQSSVSDAKRRRAVPAEWLITLLDKKCVNPEWIRFGTGGKRLPESVLAENSPAVIRAALKRPQAEHCSTDELIAELIRRFVKKTG